MPNIVVIWGDDIGISNLSCYSDGLMGYRTPNIHRIAQEGMRFTDCYGEQSRTAGRASFITGPHGLRTGLTKVGLSAAPVGLHKERLAATSGATTKCNGFRLRRYSVAKNSVMFARGHVGRRNDRWQIAKSNDLGNALTGAFANRDVAVFAAKDHDRETGSVACSIGTQPVPDISRVHDADAAASFEPALDDAAGRIAFAAAGAAEDRNVVVPDSRGDCGGARSGHGTAEGCSTVIP
jgi:hypothetical protein